MPIPILQFKRGGYSALPTLRAGEPGFTTDKYDLFVGLDNTLGNNKFFGSHRYWTRENGTRSLGLNLVDKNGTNYIQIKSPDTLAGIVTYNLPGNQGGVQSILSNDGQGNLYWGNGFLNSVFTGITTVSGPLGLTSATDSTSTSTGAIVISGGAGIAKNLTIGESINVANNLKVTGLSTFTNNVILNSQLRVAGVSTFVLDSEFNKNVRVSGITTLTTLRVTGISTLTGDTEFTNNIRVSGIATVNNFRITGLSTITGDSNFTNNLNVGGITTTATFRVTGISTLTGDVELSNNLRVAGVSTFSNPLMINSDLNVIGIGTIGNLRVTGVSTLTGDTNFTNNINVTGITTTGNFRVTGVSTLTGDTNLTNNLNVTGITTTGNFRVTGISTLSGDVRLSNNLNVLGIATVNNLKITGISTFSSDVEFNSNLKVVGVSTLSDFTINSGVITGPSSIVIDPAGIGTNTGSVRIKGDLYVDGDTTSVNSTVLKVKDSLIESGLIDNGSGILVPPTSNSNFDIGLLMHYYDSTAKKSAVYWDTSVQRVAITSSVTEASNILTPVSWAEVEMGSLWFNDCAGQSKTITCISGERRLENITIDGGSY